MGISGRSRFRSALAGAVALALVIAAPAPEASAADQRCFSATAGKRKTSFGVHQWTARQESRWCVQGRRIVSIRRRTIVKSGTNWRLVSRSGGIRRAGAQAVAEARFHFRLRYPYFEQNCYPRIEIAMWPSGRFERLVRTGC